MYHEMRHVMNCACFQAPLPPH
uniref:Uncharacterized protein n=1 Tax=Arundo donax TaxID=35708 RepID=A0A0A9ARI9_ARUDO